MAHKHRSTKAAASKARPTSLRKSKPDIKSGPSVAKALKDPLGGVDAVTRRYIRNANDERAAKEGARFSEELARGTINWIEQYCMLYEGELAGEFIRIRDWQEEVISQLFGWVVWSDHFGRWVRRFRQGSVWVPKKNAKSPTLAAIGVYLLIGDGEKGQKCYSAARDGKQAAIAHAHAIAMVDQNPELRVHCHINNQTGEINYHPTRSRYLIVTGENKKSTEGYNGTILVDEVHVVDEELMKRLKGAGISRSEPFILEMSTAADNRECYGYQRYRFGRSIAQGKIYLPNFYFQTYEAPKDFDVMKETDEAKVMEAAKIANPSLGRIVRMDEFLATWREHSTSHTKRADVGQYRFNIWGLKAGGWIDVRDWQALCARKVVDFKRLKGAPMAVGIDLSMTGDMSAISAGALDEEAAKFEVRTWHWMPRATVDALSEQIDLSQFHKVAPEQLKLIPGRAIPYKHFVSRLVWLNARYDIRVIAYDPYHATDLVKELIEKHGFDETVFFPVPQTYKYLTPAAEALERCCLNQEASFMYHEESPVLDWQFGHCQVQFDQRNNIIPIKPERNSAEKIDGIMSIVDMIAGCQYEDSLRNFVGFSHIDASKDDDDGSEGDFESDAYEDLDEDAA